VTRKEHRQTLQDIGTGNDSLDKKHRQQKQKQTNSISN
jgi:hypothetical protein